MIKEHNERPSNVILLIMFLFALSFSIFVANKFPPHKDKENIEIAKMNNEK